MSKYSVITAATLCLLSADLAGADPVLLSSASGTLSPTGQSDFNNPLPPGPYMPPNLTLSTATGFSETWIAPADPRWHGTYTASGPRPVNVPTGRIRYDFAGLSDHVLPKETAFSFSDLDQLETLDLSAFDSSGNLILMPWLEGVIWMGSTVPGTIASCANKSACLPSYEWDQGMYRFNGSGVTVAGNQTLGFMLRSTLDIAELEVMKHNNNNSFHLRAPTIPEPSSIALLALGLIGCGVWRDRKGAAS